jgi:hypothetical protein
MKVPPLFGAEPPTATEAARRAVLWGFGVRVEASA